MQMSKEHESTEGTQSEDGEMTKSKYTIRHGSHLTKLTEGVSSEENEEKEQGQRYYLLCK